MLGFLRIRKKTKHISLGEDRKLRKKQQKRMYHGKKPIQTTVKGISKFWACLNLFGNWKHRQEGEKAKMVQKYRMTEKKCSDLIQNHFFLKREFFNAII